MFALVLGARGAQSRRLPSLGEPGTAADYGGQSQTSKGTGNSMVGEQPSGCQSIDGSAGQSAWLGAEWAERMDSLWVGGPGLPLVASKGF